MSTESIVAPRRISTRVAALIHGSGELIVFFCRGAAVGPFCEGDESRWFHQVVVATHLALSAYAAGRVLAGAAESFVLALAAAVFVALGHQAVDPVNGIVHFVVDNYFCSSTPIIGRVVDNFQRHHDRPDLMTHNQLAKHVTPLMGLSIPALVLSILLCPATTFGGIAALSFVGTFVAESAFGRRAPQMGT